MVNKTDLVVDDEDFRAKQMDRVVTGVENLGSGVKTFGDYITEMKKWNKLSLYISLALFGIILISVIGGIVIVGKDNIRDVFVNPSVTRNIYCNYGYGNITLKSFQELKYFRDSINGSCVVKS